MIEHMEKAGAGQTAAQDPQRRIVDIVFAEAAPCCLTRGQPRTDRNRNQQDDAVPAQRQMPDAEDDRVYGNCEHVLIETSPAEIPGHPTTRKRLERVPGSVTNYPH